MDGRMDRIVMAETLKAFACKKYYPILDPPQYRPVLANARYANTSVIRTLVAISSIVYDSVNKCTCNF